MESTGELVARLDGAVYSMLAFSRYWHDADKFDRSHADNNCAASPDPYVGLAVATAVRTHMFAVVPEPVSPTHPAHPTRPLLRVGYLVMGGGLAVVKWPLLFTHGPWELKEGTVECMLLAMSVLAFIGLRYPLRMLPIRLFEVAWKLIWLGVIALDLRIGVRPNSPIRLPNPTTLTPATSEPEPSPAADAATPFGLHEALDQIGAMAGPLLIAAALALGVQYQTRIRAAGHPRGSRLSR